MANRNYALAMAVEDVLRSARIDFQREPALEGLRPDFVVQGPQGQLVVLEIKHLSDAPDLAERLHQQMAMYREATGATAALAVVDLVSPPGSAESVIGVDGLVDALSDVWRSAAAPSASTPPVNEHRPTVFAAMPFEASYDDVFFVAMRYAADEVGAVCRRVDLEEFSDDIVTEIKSVIHESVAVIVDLSEGKPNVLYETGFAHALNKPAVHISSTPLDELPFDVRNWNTIEYQHGRTTQLRERLAARLRAVLPASA